LKRHGQAASSGSNPKAPGSAGGYLLEVGSPNRSSFPSVSSGVGTKDILRLPVWYTHSMPFKDIDHCICIRSGRPQLARALPTRNLEGFE
jgi:hypothetical protein